MITITVDKLKYDANAKTFFGSEKDIQFATEYKVINTLTGKSQEFTFTKSTGSEFDPKTQWLYENADKTLTLAVCNDAEITKRNGANYLRAKTHNYN